MPRKHNARRSNNSVPRPMTIYDPFQAMQLEAARSDAVPCVGRYDNSITVATGVIQAFNLSPTTTFSDRLNNLGQAYQKYRIKKIIFKLQFLTPAVTGGTVFVYGVDEDLDTINPPTTAASVSAFRCSATVTGPEPDSGDVLTYIPSDRKRWYYTNAAGTDKRQSTEAVLWLCNLSNSSVTVLIEVGFRYVFCQSGGNGTFSLTDPFRRRLTVVYSPPETRNDEESDDSVIVRTPRPPSIQIPSTVKPSGSRWI
jgi:hypothetical protein